MGPVGEPAQRSGFWAFLPVFAIIGLLQSRYLSGEFCLRGQTTVSSFLAALILFCLANVLALSLPRTISDGIVRGDASIFVLDPKILQDGRPASFWIARAFALANPRPSVVVFGSSQIGGLQAADANLKQKTLDYVFDRDCPSIERHLVKSSDDQKRHKVFLLATAGAVMSDHFFAERALFVARLAPQAVVLTVSPRDFIDNSLPCAGATEPYRFYSKYSDFLPYDSLAFDKPLEYFNHFVSANLPLMRVSSLFNRLGLHKQSAKADVGTKDNLDKQKALAEAQLKFVTGGFDGNLVPGMATVAPAAPAIFVDNVRDYRRRYKNLDSPMYKTQMQFLHLLLDDLKAKHIRTFIVAMPLTAANRALLPERFTTRMAHDLAEAAHDADADFVDLSADPAFTLADFCDSVHLNARGGERLADKIGQIIK